MQVGEGDGWIYCRHAVHVQFNFYSIDTNKRKWTIYTRTLYMLFP